MIRYPEQPDNEPIPRTREGHIYRLRQGYEYEDDRYKINIYAGWLYDGASVPALATVTGIYPDGLIRAAAAIHDVLYEHNGYDTRIRPHPFAIIIAKDGPRQIPKSEADRLFYRMYRASGEERLKCAKAYLAVRAFGIYPEDRGAHNEQGRYND